MLWRNFHDAYEWSWQNNCSSWDLLDVVRMTRALTPEGIKWPFAPDGRPTNSLEYITAVNKLEHIDAHDALSDVRASIAIARLLKQKQPKIFDFLLNIRSKYKLSPLVATAEPLIYTSGRYAAEFHKTTVAVMVAEKPDKSGALMYDLRIDPDEFKVLSVEDLTKRWKAFQSRKDEAPYFPVKELKYNKCPAIAPLNMLDNAAADRLSLHREIIQAHYEKLQQDSGFGDRLLEALEGLWPPRQPQMLIDEQKVDTQLYEAFVKTEDQAKMSVVRAAEPAELSDLNLDFLDERLKALLPLYKARNFPEVLTDSEKHNWFQFRRQKLLSGNSSLADRYFNQIDGLIKMPGLTVEKRHLLQELKAYGESIKPVI
jgi:exodeoxyribonuclease-1